VPENDALVPVSAPVKVGLTLLIEGAPLSANISPVALLKTAT
jgi:hypothetical protein